MSPLPKRGGARSASRARNGPRFSVSTGGPVAEMLQRALRAEELGYDCLWIPDHLSDIPPATAVYDAFTVLAYVAARTQRIRLGSGVTDIQRMHPAKTASVVASLDNLSGGRAILGIGAGEVMNTSPYGIVWEETGKRIARLREYIQVVRLLWTSSFDSQVGFRGRSYSFKEAHLSLAPFQKPGPPVYIGAFSSDSMLRLTGQLGDGWYPGAFFSPRTFREKVAVIRDAEAAAGRRRGTVAPIVNLPVVFSDDDGTISSVRIGFKRQLIINRYMLKLLGEDAAYELVSKKLQYQLIAPTPAYAELLDRTVAELPVSDDALDEGIAQMMAVGTPAQCVEKVARFVKAGAVEVHLSSVIDDEETLETFSRKVMPSFAS